MKHKRFTILLILSHLIVLSILISACNLFPGGMENNTSSTIQVDQFTQDLPFANVEFVLNIPDAINDEVILELIDDITGIELNPTRYVMEKVNDRQYHLILPSTVPSVIKYRFYKHNNLPVYETNAENQVVEYRMTFIEQESVIYNQLTNWQDEQYSHAYGRLIGQLTNKETNSPIPNALIVAGGVHTYSSSTGRFVIDSLPPGKHNLVVAATDGEYQTFQQEAIIGEGLTTPANIGLTAAKFVNITFLVKPPENSPDTAPIRILGNTYQLGNVFGNIYTGTSITPSRAPKLTPLEGNLYTIKLSLPSGYYLRYKYSLGDGFWNAELNSEQQFVVRHIVVPETDTVIGDIIHSWNTEGKKPVEFTVNVPELTPENEIVSIQFNSFGWSPPIPMWKTGKNHWSYNLYGPFNLVGKIEYRFCRNDACGTADDGSAPVNGYSIESNNLPEKLDIKITKWANWEPITEKSSEWAVSAIPRTSDFTTGFMLSSDYNVNTPIFLDAALETITEGYGDTVIIPYKWRLQSLHPIIFSPQTGENPLWKDLVLMVQKAQNAGLQVWLSPEIELSSSVVRQFVSSSDSDNWDYEFSKNFNEFLLYTVDLSAYMNVKGIIIPTDIPHLQDFSNYEKISEVMVAEAINMNQDLRSRFKGKIYIANNGVSNIDSNLLKLVDGIFITPRINFNDPKFMNEDWATIFQSYFNQEKFQLFSNNQKELIIGLNYPSLKGAEQGCIPSGEECYDFRFINQPDLDQSSFAMVIDLQNQMELYSSSLDAINTIDWIDGVISTGFNPQVALRDQSSSIRGKPVFMIISQWFSGVKGQQ